MAGNTIMTAKSTFGDGLLMDFAPDNTQATCLTHALNATLLTMNGNELSLQNDMGNGRVETAYLPEGYIPVGTCEFGDIIYIVSYNPITNKSQIGCFPSPERNISSEELGGVASTFTSQEFVDNDEVIATSVKKIIYENNLNPGDKFIVYTKSFQTTRDGNIVDNGDYITDVGNTDHNLGKFPKNIKFSVVAIEDSGKINYLNSDLKWYDDYYIHTKWNNTEGKPDIDSYRNLLNSGYSVFQSKISGKLAILAELETVKTFDSQYLIFQQDELVTNERTSYYTRHYHIYLNCNWTSDSPDTYPVGLKISDESWNYSGKKYDNTDLTNQDIQFTKDSKNLQFTSQDVDRHSYTSFKNSNYESQKNQFDIKYINKDSNFAPKKIEILMQDNLPNLGHYIINKLKIESDGYGFQKADGNTYFIYKNGKKVDSNYYDVQLNDIFVHNHFNKDILVKLGEVIIPIKSGDTLSDLTGLTYTFKISPKMSYGYLPNLSQTHTIDFGKLNSGIINLTEWHYYNDANISTIKIGLDTYPEENKGIQKVDLEFYDNQGLTATLSLQDKNSYSGTFTETISLNNSSNSNLIPNPNGHKGQAYKIPSENWDTTSEDNDATRLKALVDQKVYLKDDKEEIYYENDAGIIYPNLLYLVKIKVYYLNKDTLGNYIEGEDPKVFYRWYWTNSMFNQYYYDYYDFNELYMDIDINLQGQFKETGNFKVHKSQVVNNNYISGKDSELPYYSLGYNLHRINSVDSNVNMKIIPFITDNYDTFALNESKLDNIACTIIEGKSNITNSEQVITSTENSQVIKDSNIIKSITTDINEDTGSFQGPNVLNYQDQNYKDWANSLKDYFTFNIINASKDSKLKTYQYSNTSGIIDETKKSYPYFKQDLKTLYSKGLDLILNGDYYQKINANEIDNTYTVATTHYKPVISNLEDLQKYNITTVQYKDKQSNNHFAFNNIVSVSLNGKYGHNDGFYLISNEGYLKLGNRFSFPDGNKNKQALSIGDFISQNGVTGAGRFSALVRHNSSKPNDSGRRNIARLCGDANNNAKDINKIWKDTWKHFDRQTGTIQWELAWGDGGYLKRQGGDIDSDYSTAQLIISTIGNRYKGLNVFWRQKCLNSEDTRITQLFLKDQNNFNSFASILVSALSRIYYLDSDNTKPTTTTVLKDIISKVDDYQIWKKEFIVKLDKKQEQFQLSDLLTLSYFAFNDYTKAIKEYIGDTNCNYNNITIQDEQIINKTNVIQFEYQIPYDVRDLVNIYNTHNIAARVYLDSDITKTYGGFKQIQNPSDILYIDNDGAVKNNTSNIYLCPLTINIDNNVLKFGYSDNKSDIKLQDIMKFLVISNGECYAKSTYSGINAYVFSYSNDDENERIGLGFDQQDKINDKFAI